MLKVKEWLSYKRQKEKAEKEEQDWAVKNLPENVKKSIEDLKSEINDYLERKRKINPTNHQSSH